MTLNSIGLDTEKTKGLADDLNQLLANFQLYYQNLRGIHWNIKGRAFFDLHVKFEELRLKITQKQLEYLLGKIFLKMKKLLT
jgi:DNA-binding ferritin-like protein